MSLTRSQKLSFRAMQQVRGIAAGKTSAEFRKEYKSRANSFPAMILQSGLAQALGFLLGKAQPDAAEHDRGAAEQSTVKQAAVKQRSPDDGKSIPGKHNAYRAYIDSLAAVIGDESAELLHEKAITSALSEYRCLTRQVLEAATFIRRFCFIELKPEDTAGKVD
jgi:CRISPR-associated protein Cmr5